MAFIIYSFSYSSFTLGYVIGDDISLKAAYLLRLRGSTPIVPVGTLRQVHPESQS